MNKKLTEKKCEMIHTLNTHIHKGKSENNLEFGNGRN